MVEAETIWAANAIILDDGGLAPTVAAQVVRHGQILDIF